MKMLLRFYYNGTVVALVYFEDLHSFNNFFFNRRNEKVEVTGIEPVTSHMRSKRSTTELYPSVKTQKMNIFTVIR